MIMADKQQDQNKRISRRSLFGCGRPSDTDEWLRGLENKSTEEKIRKWNFDFRSGKPLKEPGSESPSSSHIYEAVDEREVPEFYRTKTIRSVGATRSLEPSSPRKLLVKKSEPIKIDEKSPEKTTSVEMNSPRKNKRLRKANSLESTPQKKKKNEGIDKD